MSWPEKNKIRFLFGLFVTSLLVGIWHGFPLTSIVADEIFPGAVMRSLATHSLLPQGTDVLYGTITYYANYVFIAFFNVFGLPFLGFSLAALREFVVENVFWIYLVGRLVSVTAGIMLFWLCVKLGKRANVRSGWKIFSLSLLFSTLIVQSILHTNKVWPVSVLLLMLSFYFTYVAWHKSEPDLESKEAALPNERLWKSDEFFAILFAFLAAANFPLTGFALVCVPLLFYVNRKNPQKLRLLWYATAAGIAVLAFIFALNSHGVVAQVTSIFNDYTFSSTAQKVNVSFMQSLFLNVEKIALLYPLLLLVIVLTVLNKKQLRDSKLLKLSLIYIVVYVLSISMVARWSTSIYSYYRYLFPLGFMFLGILFAYEVKPRFYHTVILFISVVFCARGLYLLSVPTTMNLSLDWIWQNLNHAEVVIERYDSSDIELPLNQTSAEAIEDSLCGVECQMARNGDLVSGFRANVITEQSNSSKAELLGAGAAQKYQITDRSLALFKQQVVGSFLTGSKNYIREYPPLLEKMGNYFDTDFWRIERLGRNVYVYKTVK